MAPHCTGSGGFLLALWSPQGSPAGNSYLPTALGCLLARAGGMGCPLSAPPPGGTRDRGGGDRCCDVCDLQLCREQAAHPGPRLRAPHRVNVQIRAPAPTRSPHPHPHARDLGRGSMSSCFRPCDALREARLTAAHAPPGPPAPTARTHYTLAHTEPGRGWAQAGSPSRASLPAGPLGHAQGAAWRL